MSRFRYNHRKDAKHFKVTAERTRKANIKANIVPRGGIHL